MIIATVVFVLSSATSFAITYLPMLPGQNLKTLTPQNQNGIQNQVPLAPGNRVGQEWNKTRERENRPFRINSERQKTVPQITPSIEREVELFSLVETQA